MATPYTQVITQFGFKVQSGVTPLPGLTTEKVVIHELINAPATWSFFISSAYIKVFVDTFHDLMLTSTPRVFVRLGTSTAGKLNWLPWQEHLILSLTTSPKTNSHTLVMKTTDRYGEMRRGDKAAAWQGTIDQIVNKFAVANQLTPVIEAATGQFNLIQSLQNDFDFIARRLLPRAITAGGRADYVTYVRDQELHFHTVGYKKKPINMRYFFDPSIDLVHTDGGIENTYLGAAGVKTYIFDPYTGEVNTRLTQPSGLELAKNPPTLVGRRATSWTIGANQFDEATKLSQSLFDATHLNNYSIQLNTVQQLLRIDDLVDLDVTQSGRSFNPLSGRYSVSEVKHSIKVGTVASVITMTRGETN